MSTKFSKLNVIFLIVFIGSIVGLKIWQYHWTKVDVMLKEKQLHVQVAKTPYQLSRGLGKRDNLGEYDGMLFIFGLPGRIGIVMREMRFPIDIVWFEEGEVVDIASNVQTEPNVSEEKLRVYYPRADANLILELPAGWTEQNDLKIGDRIQSI